MIHKNYTGIWRSGTSSPTLHQHHSLRDSGGVHQSQMTLSVGGLVVNREEEGCVVALQGEQSGGGGSYSIATG